MPRTRTVITLLLATATAAALALGAATVASAGEPTVNRGWVTPAGDSFEE